MAVTMKAKLTQALDPHLHWRRVCIAWRREYAPLSPVYREYMRIDTVQDAHKGQQHHRDR